LDINDKKYTYDRFGMKGARVGQAVHDILSAKEETTTVEEILDEYSHKFVQELEDTISANEHKYKDIFHVFVLSNKEMWAINVVRNWFVARETAPDALDMVGQYPNHCKILYEVNKKTGQLKLKWTIPGLQDCISVVNNPNMYDPTLYQWITQCFNGGLK
jgi:hypothetical protein